MGPEQGRNRAPVVKEQWSPCGPQSRPHPAQGTNRTTRCRSGYRSRARGHRPPARGAQPEVHHHRRHGLVCVSRQKGRPILANICITLRAHPLTGVAGGQWAGRPRPRLTECEVDWGGGDAPAALIATSAPKWSLGGPETHHFGALLAISCCGGSVHGLEITDRHQAPAAVLGSRRGRDRRHPRRSRQHIPPASWTSPVCTTTSRPGNSARRTS
jgi:hypothetical protein